VRHAVGALRLGRRVFEPHALLIVADAAAWRGDPAAAMERVHAVVAKGADIVEVSASPGDVATRAVTAGVDPARIIIDVAHGENTWPSAEVTRRLEDLVVMGWPVLVSWPDQDIVGEAVNATPGERLAGGLARDLAATAVCAWLGARVFRVHRVRETQRVLSMISAIRGDIPPASAVRGLA
jgi:dihydropteroate synthase